MSDEHCVRLPFETNLSETWVPLYPNSFLASKLAFSRRVLKTHFTSISVLLCPQFKVHLIPKNCTCSTFSNLIPKNCTYIYILLFRTRREAPVSQGSWIRWDLECNFVGYLLLPFGIHDKNWTCHSKTVVLMWKMSGQRWIGVRMFKHDDWGELQ